KAEKQAEKAAKAKKEEGKMGQKEAPKQPAHSTSQGKPDKKEVAKNMAAKIFGGKGGAASLFGGGGLGGGPKSALGEKLGGHGRCRGWLRRPRSARRWRRRWRRW